MRCKEEVDDGNSVSEFNTAETLVINRGDDELSREYREYYVNNAATQEKARYDAYKATKDACDSLYRSAHMGAGHHHRSLFSREDEALLRECLQACPRHMPNVSKDEAVADAPNFALLQSLYPMLCTNVDVEVECSERAPPRYKSRPRVKPELVPGSSGIPHDEKMSREASKFLKLWFLAVLERDDQTEAYPSAATKTYLAAQSGASMKQINNWLHNARRRLRKPSDGRFLPLELVRSSTRRKKERSSPKPGKNRPEFPRTSRESRRCHGGNNMYGNFECGREGDAYVHMQCPT